MENRKNKINELLNKRKEFMQKGETIKEVSILKEVSKLIVEVYGVESDENIQILNELGGTLKYVGEYEEAEASLLKAREIIAKRYGINNVSYATCTLNLAEVYRFMKKFDETEAMYLKAKQIYEMNNLYNDYLYASLCNNLGLFYQELGKYEEALKLHEISLRILKNNPEQQLQYATTLSNLVTPYLKTGQKAKSYETLEQSLSLIEKVVGKEHNLYSASLNNMAISYFNDGELEKALDLFEKSAEICKKSFGENSDNYKNLLSNIEYVKDTIEKAKKVVIEKKENLKGLELSKKYYEEIYKPVLKNEFPELYKRIAVGLVGEGSECLGYDDEFSQDHDFGPSCCIWLMKEDYIKYGDILKKRLDELPKTYKGYKALCVSEWGEDRRGILNIEDWYYKFIGKNVAPQTLTDWRVIPETALATATNGEVFEDNLGFFTEIRQELKKYYPEDIRKNKIATRCMKMAQSGQYNFSRCMKRNDIVAGRLAETEFINELIHMIFLLNKQYLLFYKWAYKKLKELPILGEKSYKIIKDIVERPIYDLNGKESLIEEICNLIIQELKKQKLISEKITSTFLQDVGIEVQKSIEDEQLKNWSPWLD